MLFIKKIFSPKIKLLLLILLLPSILMGCTRARENIREAADEPLPITGEGAPQLPEINDREDTLVPQQIIIKTNEQEILNKILKQYQAQKISHLPEFNHYLLKLPDNKDVQKISETLDRKYQIDFARPNRLVTVATVPDTEFDFSELDYFYRGHQWALQKIQAPAAWEKSTGSSDTVIAILDTGIDYEHPDFGRRILTEEGINTLDEKEPTNFYDDHGHGTHVAGIAAAGGPGEGNMAGVSWNSLILPVKVLNEAGAGTVFSVNQGLEHVRQYARANPDKRVIINMSLDYFGHSPARDEIISSLLEENIIIVCAMGNESKKILVNPASSPGVIAVGATDVRDEKAGFSSEGSWISLTAPGEDIFSSVPDGYDIWEGTSMSAPFVAGTAALLLDKYPQLSPDDIKYHLEITADDLGPPGFNEQYGYGRINAARALTTKPHTNPRGSIEFSVNRNNRPASEVIIRLYLEDNYQHFVTVLNGKASFYDLEPGTYRADIVNNNQLLKQIPFTITEGEAKTLSIEI